MNWSRFTLHPESSTYRCTAEARVVQFLSLAYAGAGVYFKVEGGGVVHSRGKVVRADFIAGNEHWSRGPLRLNIVHRPPTDA